MNHPPEKIDVFFGFFENPASWHLECIDNRLPGIMGRIGKETELGTPFKCYSCGCWFYRPIAARGYAKVVVQGEI